MTELIPNLTSSKRNSKVDFLKVIAIFGVVYIHSSFGDNLSNVFSAFFRWAVPLFLIFFGYFCERGIIKAERKINYLMERFVCILVPCLVWSAIYWFGFSNPAQQSSFGFVQFLSTLGFAWSGQYFFLLILQLLIFFPFLRWLADSRAKIISTLIVFLLALIFLRYYSGFGPKFERFIEIIGFRTCVLWWPYTVVGIFLANEVRIKLPKWILLCPLMLIIESAFVEFNKFSDPYFNPYVALASLVLAVYAFDEKEHLFHENATPMKFIESIAQSTMGIFVMNPLILYWVHTSISLQATSTWSQFLLTFAISIIVTLICWILTLAIKRIKCGFLVGC
jgi:surface polysaccharide O-acyltransferase-like enzyme